MSTDLTRRLSTKRTALAELGFCLFAHWQGVRVYREEDGWQRFDDAFWFRRLHFPRPSG